MREILDLCVELDTAAVRIYEELASCCEDVELATMFGQMAIEEKQHVTWWEDLRAAWEDGLIPDIALEADLIARLNVIHEDMAGPSRLDCASLSTDQMLDLAAHLEFYMLDPVFAEILDLMQPDNRMSVHESYSRHVERLISAIESRYTSSSLATFFARVLRRAFRDRQRLAALAMRDPLTSLYNRRGAIGYIEQWLSWSARYGHPIAVALIDVDNFKALNDNYGHKTGDRALIAIGRCLTDAVRGSDIVGRFGGDEFLVLAPEIGGGELNELMERICTLVRDVDVQIDGARVPLSVSAGGAWVGGGTLVAAEAFIAHADESLYAAKDAGRDRAGEPVFAGP